MGGGGSSEGFGERGVNKVEFDPGCMGNPGQSFQAPHEATKLGYVQWAKSNDEPSSKRVEPYRTKTEDTPPAKSGKDFPLSKLVS